MILDSLPDPFKEALREYNTRAVDVFGLYLKTLGEKIKAERGEDKQLPLSGVGRTSALRNGFIKHAYQTDKQHNKMLLSCKAQVGVIAVQKLLYRIVKHLEQLIILGVIEIKYCIVLYCIVLYFTESLSFCFLIWVSFLH